MSEHKTIQVDVADGVAWVTMNRPEALNAFNTAMQTELSETWRAFREDETVRCIVLTGAGDRAFCTGIDRNETMAEGAEKTVGAKGGTPFHFDDPGDLVGPKSNDLWKPVIAAVNGIACGGAFYMLGEADVIIAAEDATFFDPHLTYGMAAVFESIHMLQKMPLGELLRMQLAGSHERVSAQRAYEVGLVSEVVPVAELREAAGRFATIVASQPPLAVQATLRTIWSAHELTRSQALGQAFNYVATGTDADSLAEGQQVFESGQRVDWRLR